MRHALHRGMTKQAPANAPATPTSSEVLLHDHARLDQLFAALIEAFRADARGDCNRLWTEFDTGINAHLAYEEKCLFPTFQSVDANEAASLLREHHEIRALVNELGIGVDLHMINAAVVEALVEKLRAHAKREESILYRWANGNVVVDGPFRVVDTATVATG